MSDARDSVKVKDSEVTVGDTGNGDQLVAEDPERKFLLISNEGGTDMVVRFGGDPATPTTGHTIVAGGNLLMDKRVPQSEVRAIVASGSTTAFVSEGK